jgi:hypothetical protein
MEGIMATENTQQRDYGGADLRQRLSASLADLRQRVKAIEDSVDTALAQGVRKLEQSTKALEETVTTRLAQGVQESIRATDLQARGLAELELSMTAVEDSVASGWNDLRVSVQATLERTRAERDARTEERAEQADETAAAAIAFASFAVQVAETAVLEANRARAEDANQQRSD